MFRNQASEFVYVRTYSRWLEEQGRRENWPETVQRYINFIKKHLGDKIPSKVLRKIDENVSSFNVMPSMRFIWAAGGPAEQDNVTIYNCSFAAIDNQDAFAEALYILMCGCGYGFSVENKYISQLPFIPKEIFVSDIVHKVVDSKTGWADSIKELINQLYNGQEITMDYNEVRPAGARLKTMGGRASGPGPLAQLHSFIKEIFYDARGRQLH
jgi:ribonucleoside-diphosphate reductase alpha chain